jgi:uncharacterized RDD family membrane protein YckC
MNDLILDDMPLPVLAKKRVRFLAALIDYLIFLVVYFMIGFSFGERYTPEQGGIGFQLNGLPAFGCILFWFLMFPIIEGLNGQTLGKMLLSIKVIKNDYSKSSISHSLVRHLFDVVDYLPFFGIVGIIVASNTDLKQRVGDLVAKTIVVIK